nr:hypothetical protein [Frankia sp. Mgl5]
MHADADGLSPKEHRETMELFQSDIAPVLRREIPSRPFPTPPPLPADTLPDAQTAGPVPITASTAVQGL